MTETRTASTRTKREAIRAAQRRVVETWDAHTEAIKVRDDLLRTHDVHNGGTLSRADLAADTDMTEVAVGRRITKVLEREGVPHQPVPRQTRSKIARGQ